MLTNLLNNLFVRREARRNSFSRHIGKAGQSAFSALPAAQISDVALARRERKTKQFTLLLTLFFLLFATAIPTEAHGYVIRSIPQDRSTLERPPARVQYWFSEALEPQFSEIKLRDQEGTVIATGGVDEQDDTLLSLRVPSDLDDGAYIVELRPAFASDGHVIIESRVFFVGESVAGVAGQAADNTPRLLEIIWKALLFNAQYLMFGAAVLYSYVFVPVWGSTKYPRGLLPPRVMRRLTVMMWGGLGIALVTNVMALFQQSMVFFGVGFATVIEGNLWNVVRIGSRFGDVWHFRMVCLLVIAIMQGAARYYGRRHPKVVRSFWVVSTWAIALMIGAQAVNSHAAGALVMAWVSMLIHWLHTIAVAFWVGGIAALAMVLPVALRPYDGEARWQALRPVMMRFSRYVVGAVLVVITSGIYSASLWFYQPADVATTYGSALGAKLAMVMLLLLVAALHHMALHPNWLRRIPVQKLVNWAKKFGASMRLETMFAIVTLTVAATVSATPIPQPEFLQVDVATPRDFVRVGDYDVQMTIAPGGTGVNTLDVTVTQAGEPLADARVELQIVSPTNGSRTRWQAAEYADDGLYVIASDAIDETGTWWTLVDIFDDDNIPTRAAFAWAISDDANVVQSLSPSLWTILAALATLASVLYVMLPALRRLAEILDWSPVTLVIAVGSILMSVILIGGSIWFLQQQERLLNQQVNPPPARVNPILPTQASINRGESLYLQHCIAMQTSADFRNLVLQFPFLGDSDLYQAIERGWRDVPPCDDALTDDTERWHVVNYLRTRRLLYVRES